MYEHTYKAGILSSYHKLGSKISYTDINNALSQSIFFFINPLILTNKDFKVKCDELGTFHSFLAIYASRIYRYYIPVFTDHIPSILEHTNNS